MNEVKGLNDFCKKHRIPMPAGDKFSLLDFLLEVSKKSVPLAEYRGKVSEIIQRLGNESEEWGGCPNCGTNVHLGLKECPVCGKSLDFVDPELEADDLSDLDPSYSKPKKSKTVDDLDDFDSDDEEADEEPSENEDVESEEESSDDDLDEIDEIEEDEESEEHDEDDQEDTEEDDDSLESDSDDEEEPEEDEEEEDAEPLSGPKKAAQQGNHFLSKKPINRPQTEHAEKYAVREVRRKKLESLIPKFKKDPNLIMRLQYRDLLIMPGLLGYTRKPTAIGSKDDIQRWVKNALKGGLKK